MKTSQLLGTHDAIIKRSGRTVRVSRFGKRVVIVWDHIWGTPLTVERLHACCFLSKGKVILLPRT